MQRARARILADALNALEGRDVLVAPSCGIAAPRIAEVNGPPGAAGPIDMVQAILRFTSPFNASGQPALAIPTGLSDGGLPVSMQIVGRPFDEASVLRLADAYERSRGPLPAPAGISV
jgi:Asp-tRNA(Asn)/Glu-tRNA(Gln) amidotransferase A subunit family amidase